MMMRKNCVEYPDHLVIVKKVLHHQENRHYFECRWDGNGVLSPVDDREEQCGVVKPPEDLNSWLIMIGSLSCDDYLS